MLTTRPCSLSFPFLEASVDADGSCDESVQIPRRIPRRQLIFDDVRETVVESVSQRRGIPIALRSDSREVNGIIHHSLTSLGQVEKPPSSLSAGASMVKYLPEAIGEGCDGKADRRLFPHSRARPESWVIIQATLKLFQTPSSDSMSCR